MDDGRVNRAGQDILHAIAGLPVEEGNAALISALGCACGGIAQLSGEPIEAAFAMIDAISSDAKATVQKHWGTFEAELVN